MGVVMGHAFHEIAFTDAVKARQSNKGSRKAYANAEGDFTYADRLDVDEISFIADRDSFYLASVSETG